MASIDLTQISVEDECRQLVVSPTATDEEVAAVVACLNAHLNNKQADAERDGSVSGDRETTVSAR